MGFKHIFWLILSPLLLCGFKLLPHGNLWDINNSSATSRKLFVVYDNPTTAIENDFPEDDPLYGTATVTIQQVMNSILDDYNNIQGSFLTLVDSNDADYATYGATRSIKIVNGTALGLTSGGYAAPSWNGVNIDGCQIVFKGSVFEKARYLAFAATHEIGHCLGLSHPMDTVNSIMSYYVDQNKYRLQIDDKMGLIYSYPQDKTKAEEEATFGFACSRK